MPYTKEQIDKMTPAEMMAKGKALVAEAKGDKEMETQAQAMTDRAKDAMKTMSRQYAKDLRNVEVFSTGVWNGDTYTEADLDSMVSAYYSLGIKPPLKLGHDEAQKWFGQKDGAPALGWIENLRRFGKKLVADLADVPDALHGMITSKRYRTKSAEVYWNYKDSEGRIWPRVLRAVALLGADLPAVTDLQDLQMALMADGTRDLRTYGSDGDVRTYSDEDGGKSMDKEQAKKYEDRISELEKQVGDEKKRTDDAESRAVKAETDAALKVFSLEVEALVKDGKALPAEVEGLKRDFADMGIKPRKYGEQETTWGQNKIEELKKRTKLVDFKEQAQGGDDDKDKDDSKPSVHELTVKVQRERGIKYSEARDIVRIEHPEEWASYIGGGKK